MKLVGPESFDLTFDAASFQIRASNGGTRLTPRACSQVPKLYTVSSGGQLVSVGVTKQPLRSRLRLGWSAGGETGYYGYAWRRVLTEAELHVWYHEDSLDRSTRDVETIEAVVAFLVRLGGQWPQHQTEIHFFPSNDVHRQHAKSIVEVVARLANDRCS